MALHSSFVYDAENDVCYRTLDFMGFPGYRVGDDGSSWFAWITCRTGRRLTDRWKPMKPGTHKKGYLYVNLTPPAGGKYTTFRVHRLVLLAFAGPCPEGMECRHLNGVKADCRLGNVMWGTPEQNRQDNRDLNAYARGESHSQAKLTDAAVHMILDRYEAAGVRKWTRASGDLIRLLATEHGVSEITVRLIVHHGHRAHVA